MARRAFSDDLFSSFCKDVASIAYITGWRRQGSPKTMHEYSIIQSLLTRVEEEAHKHGAVSVQRIELRIGEQSGVEMDLLTTAFETFRHGSICAKAELTVTPVPAIWRCPVCQRELGRGDILLCADCRLPAQLVAGDEIILDRIEMEAA